MSYVRRWTYPSPLVMPSEQNSYFYVLRIDRDASITVDGIRLLTKRSRPCVLVCGFIPIIQVSGEVWTNNELTAWIQTYSTSHYVACTNQPTTERMHNTKPYITNAAYLLYSWVLLPHPYGSRLPIIATFLTLHHMFLHSFGRAAKPQLWLIHRWGGDAYFSPY